MLIVMAEADSEGIVATSPSKAQRSLDLLQVLMDAGFSRLQCHYCSGPARIVTRQRGRATVQSG